MSTRGWIGVDLDGTLAHYDGWKGIEHIGEPVPAMLERVKAWLVAGQEVRIFTARVCPDACQAAIPYGPGPEYAHLTFQGMERIVAPIHAWCEKYLGRTLPITNEKDLAMIALWDDRCVQVIPNTGLRVDGQP